MKIHFISTKILHIKSFFLSLLPATILCEILHTQLKMMHSTAAMPDRATGFQVNKKEKKKNTKQWREITLYDGHWAPI